MGSDDAVRNFSLFAAARETKTNSTSPAVFHERMRLNSIRQFRSEESRRSKVVTVLYRVT